jgi:hypothetical protein
MDASAWLPSPLRDGRPKVPDAVFVRRFVQLNVDGQAV